MLIEDFSFNGIKLSEKNGYLTSENKELYQLRLREKLEKLYPCDVKVIIE